MKVKSESEVAQLCPTLCDPMDCSLPGTIIHGIFQVRVLEWGTIVLSNIYIHTYIIFMLLLKLDKKSIKQIITILKQSQKYFTIVSLSFLCHLILPKAREDEPSENNAQLCMCLVVKVKSDAVNNSIA